MTSTYRVKPLGEGSAVTTDAIPKPQARAPGGFDPSPIALTGFGLLLAVLVLLPPTWLVVFSVMDHDGKFTLENFERLFSDPDFVDPLIVTLIIAPSVGFFCALVAAPLGWLEARTDMPLRRTV